MSHDAAETHHAFELLLNQIHGVRRSVVRIQERLNRSQGASGSQVRYFDVTSTDPQGGVHQDTLVTKAASLLERRILQLLSDQHCAVPLSYIPDVTSDGRAPVYMPYLDARPPLDLGFPRRGIAHRTPGRFHHGPAQFAPAGLGDAPGSKHPS